MPLITNLFTCRIDNVLIVLRNSANFESFRGSEGT